MPFWSVSTLMSFRLATFSAASFVLIFVVMTESLTKVAGFARSWSLLVSSAYDATGTRAALITKQAVASLYLIFDLLLWLIAKEDHRQRGSPCMSAAHASRCGTTRYGWLWPSAA